MSEDDEPQRLGGELRYEGSVGRVHWFDGGVYAVDIAGLLTVEELRPILDFIYGDPATLSPHAVIFRELPGADYHRSALTFYQNDVPRPLPALVGVVSRRAGTRMVVMATALGFRAVTGVPMRVYDDLIGALVDARLAVGQRR